MHNLSLTVRAGETFALIGENGSGKSAILQTIAGMMEVEEGTATAFGYEIFKSFRFMSDNFLSFVMQEPAVVEDLTPL